MNPIMDEIAEQKATTRTGVALQAEAFAVNNIDCFLDAHDDPHERYVSGFITSVCAFLGTVPPPLVTLDADEVAAFKSGLEARLIATPIDEDNRHELVAELLDEMAVQS
jgi:hypothetical protein